MRRALPRRAFLGRAVLLAGASLVLTGHTPYRHWDIYRQAHLLIGCHKGDPETYALAQEAVAVLAEHLPKAKARVARAPHPERLASLIGTGQLFVTVLGRDEAFAMASGAGAFAPYGAQPLQRLGEMEAYLLVAHAELPKRHAWLITEALFGSRLMPETEGTATQAAAAEGAVSLPWHPGSRAFLDGEPEPPAQ